MNKILSICLCVIFTSLTHSQSFRPLKPDQVFSQMWDGKRLRNILLTNESDRINKESSKPYYESIGGSPFLNDQYSKVQINSYKTKTKARYDAYKDNFEVILDNNRSNIFYLNKYVGNTIKFLDLGIKYKALKYKDKNEFFKVLDEDGDVLLLIKERKKLVGGKKPKSSYDPYVQPYFKDKKTSYYISFDGKEAIEIPKRVKKFAKLFVGKNTEIAQYIKDQEISLKDRRDLKKLFKYYKSL